VNISSIIGTAQDMPYPGNSAGTGSRKVQIRQNDNNMKWWDGGGFNILW